MARSTRSTRSRRSAWLLALVGTGLAVSLGCEPGRANAPLTTMAGPATKPSADIVESDGSGANLPCFANSRACGSFKAVVWTAVQLNEPYVTIFPGHNGAAARTWSPTNEGGLMSVIGSATMVQGKGTSQRQTVYTLNSTRQGTSAGDGFDAPSTCATEYNAVFGTTRSSAQGGSLSTLSWEGVFSDVKSCADPNQAAPLSCDANGTPVDEGGDPANCPGDDSGTPNPDDGTGTGSGIQYYAGDYTNGETVNWATGIGDGGTSVCGQDAQVEYVCIDIWDGANWDPYSCGYATTC